MSKCCHQTLSCHPDALCKDPCISPLCGDPSLLAVYAPMIYDEIGINICQTLTIDNTIFSTLTNAERAVVQVLSMDFSNSEITPSSGRPNCTEITLQNLTVTLLIRLYSCSDQLLGTFVQPFTYLPPTTAAGYNEETNPSSVSLELFTPYGISYTLSDTGTEASPLISYLGFTSDTRSMTQGLNAIAYPKVLDLNVTGSEITVGLTLVISSVFYSQYLIPHQGKVPVPKGTLDPQDDSLCLNFVNGDLLNLNIKPLELGGSVCEEPQKNTCS